MFGEKRGVKMKRKITERYQNGFYRSVLRVLYGNIVFTKDPGKNVSGTYLSLCDRVHKSRPSQNSSHESRIMSAVP
jgi:hypothetical protein